MLVDVSLKSCKMNSSRNTRNAKTRRTRSSGELELDESHIVEERLKNLLTNVREPERPRNIFNNIQEVPKLRRSVVARAVQNVVCSTPMPMEKKRDFFYAENSLNISPIDPICEGDNNHAKKVQDDEPSKKIQNTDKLDIEAKVILTRASLPIIISDSEDEREIQSILQEGGKDLCKNVETRNHYNTRSESGKTIEKQKSQNNENIENIPNNIEHSRANITLRDTSNSKQPTSRNTLSVRKNKSVQKNKRSNRTHSKQIKVDSLKNESISNSAVERTNHSTQYKSPKSNSRLKNQEYSGINEIATTPCQKKNISYKTSDNRDKQNVSERVLKSPNGVENLQRDSERTVSPRKTSRLHNNENLKESKIQNEATEKYTIKTRSHDLSTAHISRKQPTILEETNVSTNRVNITNKTQKNVTYRTPKDEESNTKGQKSCDIGSKEKIILKGDLSKNKSTENFDVCYQNRISPRKLSFASNDEGKSGTENASGVIQENQIISEVTNKSTKISKIPVSRSRSRSKDKNLYSNLRNIDRENINSPAIKDITSPPKRPPRKKMLKKTLSVSGKYTKIKDGKLREDKHVNNFAEQTDSIEAKGITSTGLSHKKPDQFNCNDVQRKETSLVLNTGTKLDNENDEQDKNDEADGTIVYKTQINSEKTLVEIGTSPIILTSKENDKTIGHPTEMVEAGTSTCNFSDERYIFPVMDNDKAEKLNLLILKISQRYQDSSIPADNTISDTCLQKNNLCNQNKNPSETMPDCLKEPFRLTMANKEIQTSLKRTGSRRRKRRSFKTRGSRKRTTSFEKRDSSKSSSTLTDTSEVIKNLDKQYKQCVLYQSLEKNLTINLSSSNDEVFEETFHSNLKNHPWRVDENMQIFPRRSSYKLNFLKSAQEIEMEKELRECKCQTDSESEYNGNKINTEDTKRNKVRVYTRKTQYPSDNVDRRSPGSVMSDLVITESDSDHNYRQPLIMNNNSHCTEKRKTPCETNKNKKALTQTNIESVLNENDIQEENKKLPLKGCTTTSKKSFNKSKYNDEINSRSDKEDKINKESGNKRISNSKPNKEKSFDHLTENDNEDDEILAVPLEDSDPPALEVSAVRTRASLKSFKESDKTTNNAVEAVEQHCSTENVLDKTMRSPVSTVPSENQNTVASLTEKSQVKKPVKAKAQKSRAKKVITENEDGVSSTTQDSEEVTGLRRSGRERKAVQMRCYGAVATHSEKVWQYFNGLSLTSNSGASKATKKPRTKKKELTKNEAKDEATVKQAGKKGKRGRRKKDTSNIKPQDPKIDEPRKNSLEVLHNSKVQGPGKGTLDMSSGSNKQVDDLNSSQMENNEVVINEVGNGTEIHTDSINSRTKKHHVERDCDSSRHTSQEIIPNKKSKTPSNDNRSAVSPRNRNSLRILSDKVLNSPGNANFSRNYNNMSHVCETDNNGKSNEADDNVNCFLSPSHITPNGYLQSSTSPDQLNSVGEFTTVNKAIDKDSGRSTMLRSTFEESNVRIHKPLTGRIDKNYKKKGNVCTKISKVLSRSINTSKEHEILNENRTNAVVSFSMTSNDVDVRSVRSSIMQLKPMDSQYINLLSNDELITIKYVEETPKFKLVKDNLMVWDGIKNVKDGGTAGYLKLPPACQKALHIARKFALFYFVIEGEGFIQVHNKTSKIGKLSTFVIPLGIEYSILNTSNQDALILGFVKMPPHE